MTPGAGRPTVEASNLVVHSALRAFAPLACEGGRIPSRPVEGRHRCAAGSESELFRWRWALALLVIGGAAAGTAMVLIGRDTTNRQPTTTTALVHALIPALTEETRSTFAAGYACNPVQGLAAGVAEPYCADPRDIRVYGDGISVLTGWSASPGMRAEARELCIAVAQSLPPVPYLYVKVDGRRNLLLAWSSAAGTRRCSS